MKRILNIAWKDFLLILSDRASLILMFAAPVLLTLGLGAVTGSFYNSPSSLQEIPIVIVNQDQGEMGGYLVETFTGGELANLFKAVISDDLTSARQQVESDQIAAVLIIPNTFSDNFTGMSADSSVKPGSAIEVYASPARPISLRIIQTVVDNITSQMDFVPVTTQSIIQQLIQSGRIDPGTSADTAQSIRQLLNDESAQKPAVTISTKSVASQEDDFNYLAYLAPGMAVFFLMYTVTQGGRSLISEREMGTFGRMRTTPTTENQILAGKIIGIFLTGFFQVGVLVLISSIMFNLRWGNPVSVLILVMAVVFGATGWGILLAAAARNSYQVASTGSALMLIFGILGGTFIPVSEFSPIIRQFSKITPNYWALQGFTHLAVSNLMGPLIPILIALVIMGFSLFLIAVLFAKRRWADSGFTGL